MTTPGKPRHSAIPAPGRTGIPTPGRSRSISGAPQQNYTTETEYMSRALTDAIKANDPSQYRITQNESQNGRRYMDERPTVKKPQERAKTPVTQKPISRPPSRHSDIFGKAITRPFEIGDNVRIDSLGLEGTLRYLGEIEGKNGQWAGVELSGQFAGRGKNNGSVNGIPYFSCPDNSGVFVAVSKLAPARVYMPRPSSVASSRNGRATPSLSGQNTPSLPGSRVPSLAMSSGRVTPSNNGHITPGLSSGRVTPGIPIKSNPLSKSTIGLKGDSRTIPTQITPGSRASKYANMTAKQLSSRKNRTGSPTKHNEDGNPVMPSSPSPVSRTLSSPTRPPGSPFTTPKAGLGSRVNLSLSSSKGRPSASTPRARVPSAVAMPPPASPISASRSASLSKSGLEDLSLTNLELQGKALQDRVALLLSSGNEESIAPSLHRPQSAQSMVSNAVDDQFLESLQSRVEKLENENDRLRAEKEKLEASDLPDVVQRLREDHDKAAQEISKLLKEKEELEKVYISTSADLEDLKDSYHTSQNRITELESDFTVKLEESQRSVTKLTGQLSEAHSTCQKLEEENQQLILIKDDLTAQIDELGTQVDELRLAGQETIALYEERLSVAESQRYELETRISNLEKGNHKQDPEHHPSQPSSQASATEIDNEALRDQVSHLQKKVTSMEDLIEDSRLASEKEETLFRERMQQLKEKEESMKLELLEGKKEVERMAKAEASARSRVEEIEEALRESRVALENARAEIESLRAELSNLESLDQKDDLQAENTKLQDQNAELAAQIADLMNKVTGHTNELDALRKKAERDLPTPLTNGDVGTTPLTPSKLDSQATREEITGLKHIVQELQKEYSAASQQIKLLESENQILKSEKELLRSEADHLRQEVQVLEDGLNQQESMSPPEAESSGGSAGIEALQRSLKQQKIRYETDIEQLRKRLTEVEMNHARATHDLNKEISELEALVESKIYREDELEQEIERLKEKLSKAKKSTKHNHQTNEPRHPSTAISLNDSNMDNIPSTSGSVCEICERPGHDIFNCDLLKDDVPTSFGENSGSRQPYCPDCETWGHAAAECPHSQDVF